MQISTFFLAQFLRYERSHICAIKLEFPLSSMGKLFTRLQRVLKVNDHIVLTNTRPQSNTPLSNSSLDDSLVEAMPLFVAVLTTISTACLVEESSTS